MEVLEQLKRWVERLRARLGKATVILYGSYARGDFNLWSDVDVIIVSEAFEGTRFTRRWLLIEPTQPPPGVEAVAWTPREAAERLSKPAWRHALSHGCIVLLDDYSLAPRACKSIDALIAELKKRMEALAARGAH